MTYSATAFQLTHLLQRAFRPYSRVTTATGGSATTVIDTKFEQYYGDSNADDLFNGGTVIVVKDAAGAGADPEGRFAYISDYTASSYTITMDTVTGLVASGDTIQIVDPEWPLRDMIEIVNDALEYIGDVRDIDISLTTASSQTEYDIPAIVPFDKIVMVERQGITTDANDNRYFEIPRSEYRVVPPSSPGGTAVLRFIHQPISGYVLRLTFEGVHPRVSAYDDAISKMIHPRLAVASVTAHAYQWYNRRNPGNDGTRNQEDRAWQYLATELQKHRVSRQIPSIQGMAHWAGHGAVVDEFKSPDP